MAKVTVATLVRNAVDGVSMNGKKAWSEGRGMLWCYAKADKLDVAEKCLENLGFSKGSDDVWTHAKGEYVQLDVAAGKLVVTTSYLLADKAYCAEVWG